MDNCETCGDLNRIVEKTCYECKKTYNGRINLNAVAAQCPTHNNIAGAICDDGHSILCDDCYQELKERRGF